MSAHRRIALAMLLGLTLAGCTSGSNPPSCSFDDPAQVLPTPAANSPGSGSTWPKFRANVQNTGTVRNVTVSMNAQVKLMFPAANETPKGPFVASPVLNNGESDIYIGSTGDPGMGVIAGGTLYKLNTSDLTIDTTPIDTNPPSPTPPAPFNLISSQAITSTAVVATRDGQDAIFVGAGDGFLYGANGSGGPQQNFWPFLFGSYLSGSPTLSPSDGTVYIGAENGLFSGICPNGITRFAGATNSIESSPAMDNDNTVYVGADDRQLRAFLNYGPLKWSFAAAGPIVTAPVVEILGSSTFVYVADLGGRVFKVNATTGSPVPDFRNFPRVAPIASSPALANGHLYFGSDDGTLYAINTGDGSIVWSVPTGDSIVSSPAVATVTDQGGNPIRTIVVVGSKDGNLYFVDDDSTPTPTYTALALCPQAMGGMCDGSVCRQPPCLRNQPQAIESSPAIGSDGTVYVGTDGGRVFAIQ